MFKYSAALLAGILVFSLVACAHAAAPRPELVAAARAAQDAHAAQVKRTDTFAIIDYSLPSNVPRLFLVDRASGKTDAYLVAHGRGSDPGFTGQATRFSNDAESRASSLGAYVTGNTYQGAHGLSLKLIGLDASDDHALGRAIVLHGAAYVAPGRAVLGRSWGCPAVEPRYVQAIINRLKDGALLYVAR